MLPLFRHQGLQLIVTFVCHQGLQPIVTFVFHGGLKLSVTFVLSSRLKAHFFLWQAMWLMLQQSKPDDYVVSTGECHSVREFVELAFAEAGITIV